MDELCGELKTAIKLGGCVLPDCLTSVLMDAWTQSQS